MKINKYIFWILSFVISLISCWLFERSSTEIFSDADYMQSLNLDPHADTPMIPIAGGFLLAAFAAIVHGIFHLTFLIYLIFNKKLTIIKVDLKFKKDLFESQNIILTISLIICLYWIIDFIQIIRIKIFVFNSLFLIAAILTTLIYATWIINIFKSRTLIKEIEKPGHNTQ